MKKTPTAYSMAIGSLIRYARELARLTQVELSTRLGVTSFTISRWEAGHTAGALSQMEALQRELPALEALVMMLPPPPPPRGYGPQTLRPGRAPIAVARVAANLTQRQLAAAAGITNGTIHDLETRRNKAPSYEKVVRIVEALRRAGLDVTAEQLFPVTPVENG